MTESANTLLSQVRQHVQSHLLPLAAAIDQDGLYPEEWLRQLGALGGFAGIAPQSMRGSGLGLATQLDVVDAVGRVCGSTAFTLWSQGSFAWYLRQSSNTALRERLLPAVLNGELLAGSGLSNSVKHLAGIERSHLHAEAVPGGYRVQGVLPWVSNLGEEHVFATAAELPDGRHVAFSVPCNAPGITLRPCPPFAGMEGTRTLNVRFAQVHIPAADVLAEPEDFTAFIPRIQPGFILLQVGMATGIIAGCLDLIRQSNLTHTVTNAWLDDQPERLEKVLAALRHRARALAQDAEAGRAALLPVLETRLQASELALRAAQSAALHAGARGYLLRHAAQRRSREAMFVAIVTPALKQLRYDIARLRRAASPAAELACAA